MSERNTLMSEANEHLAAIFSGQRRAPFIIAEMSGNHNNSLERALEIVEAAAKAGAHALKLQTYTADALTIDHDGPGFRIEGGLWDGHNLYQLYEDAHMPWEWHKPLFERGRELGLVVFSTPESPQAVELLEDVNCPIYKITSFEAVDLPFIRHVASTGKPLIISTGMADEEEIAEAVAAARDGGCKDLILLHCVSGYPTPPEDANLLTIPDMREKFGVPVGLSDHTLGTAVAVAATALGAVAIEKHFTLSRADGGVDSAFSMEPHELEQLVRDTAIAFKALGDVNYERKSSEKGNMVFRRSLYAVKDIAAGEELTAENMRSIRPGYGLKPKHYDKVLGRRAKVAIPRGTPLSWDLLE